MPRSSRRHDRTPVRRGFGPEGTLAPPVFRPTSPGSRFALPALLLLLAAGPALATGFYVSPGGSDEHPGTAEEPFATLARARDAVRRLKETRGLPPGGVVIHVRPGVHRLTEPLELTAEDSGTEDAPIVYRGEDRGAARISGGRVVGGFRPVTGASVVERLHPSARGRVLQADAAESGVTDFGAPVGPGVLELFFRDEPMRLARWPDRGFTRVVDVVGDRPHIVHGIRGNRDGRFTYEGDRPRRWLAEKDIRLHGYWFWDWADAYEKVGSIDVDERVISTVPPYHHYGYRAGQRYYALNLLAELDEPGEWYLDRDTGTLYFWPPAPLEDGSVVVSLLTQLVVLRDVSWCSLEGLVFEAVRGTAVTIAGGTGNRVVGSTVRNAGGWGVAVSGGARHAVVASDIYRTGEGAVSLSGGDRATLTPAAHVAENNHIHHFARLRRTYRPGIRLRGVGHRVAHNLIHDGPHNAILLGGNDHVIELNEIHHVCYETGDVGAFYMGRDWTERGTVIRHNFFHHIRGPGLHGAMAVYLDDAASGITVSGNVFYRAGRAAFIGGGRDNLIENNVFVDCDASVHVDARGTGWMRSTVEGLLPERLRAVPYRHPPWSEKYPSLLTLLDDEPGLPKGNVVRRNISVGGKWLDVERSALPLIELEDNLVDRDPGFVDAQALDFRLRPGSPALALGFRPVPVEKVGPYRDQRRKSVPESPRRPPPPGPFVEPASAAELRKTAFRADQPVVGTYYFYWYDIETEAHFVDPDGTDALTRHPAGSEGYSYKLASWHRGELEEIMASGIDFVLPVYWGYPGDYGSWSFAGLPPLVEAARRLEEGGERSPRIGCFYDTSTLRHNREGYHADLATREGREWFYTTVRDFFSLIPHDLWATIDGRPILWLYSAAFARRQDPDALDELRVEFRRDFGVEPYVVKEISWQGRADATYAWGAALRPSVHGVAAVGPGYDHSAVPGRSPLVRDREGGARYRRAWEWVLRRPLSLRPRIAVVETWNEWHEGTDIAPSLESGRLYVEITREYTDLWHEGRELRPEGRFAERREVSITLGDPNRGDGLEQNEEPDGKTRALEVRGKSCRETVKTRHGGRYVYFDVADSFYWAEGRPVVVEVTYLDDGTAPVGFDYDSTDTDALLSGAFKPARGLPRSGTGKWRTARARLEDAAFTGRANHNDFRLVDSDGTLKVHKVVVRRDD